MSVTQPGFASPWQQRATVGLFWLFLSWIVVVPVVQFTRPGTLRYGWQMFSKQIRLPRYFVVSADGQEREFKLDDHVVHLRAEVDWNAAVVAHVRRTEPDAVAVRWRYNDVRTEEVRWGR
jgi:hypothetical protein